MLQHSSDISAKHREPLVIIVACTVVHGVAFANYIYLRRLDRAEFAKILDAERTHRGMQSTTITPSK